MWKIECQISRRSLTFIDDCTHYTWVYTIEEWKKWKALVEWNTLHTDNGGEYNTLHTDNGGEYVSSKFEDYMKSEGIHHEWTVPKAPEQTGVAKRMNRILMKTVWPMLADVFFWAMERQLILDSSTHRETFWKNQANSWLFWRVLMSRMTNQARQPLWKKCVLVVLKKRNGLKPWKRRWSHSR